MTGGSFSVRCRSDAPRCAASISRSSMCSSARGRAPALGVARSDGADSPKADSPSAGRLSAINDTEHFLQGGDAEENLFSGVRFQGKHAAADRGFLHDVRAGPLQAELADLV